MELLVNQYQYLDTHTHSPAPAGVMAIRNILAHEAPQFVGKAGFFSIGVHPWCLHENLHEAWEYVERSANSTAVLAIGEAGLDRVIDMSWQLQSKIFYRHIELAEAVNKPLIIHCVRAYSELIAFRKQTAAKQAWVVHGFTGNPTQARELLRYGIYLSFGEMLLKSPKLQRTFADIPIENILLETDVSELGIAAIYESAAQLRQISPDELGEQLRRNFTAIFRLVE